MKLEKYCNTCKFHIEGKCTERAFPDVKDGIFQCWLPSYSCSIELLKLLEPEDRDKYLFSDVYEEEHLLRKIETGSFEEKEEEK